MSLSELETALAEYVGDVLVNDCHRPEPDRILRYHGARGLPDDCCSKNGTLSISWERGYPSLTFPASAGTNASSCTGFRVYVLKVRYVVCWPGLDVNAIDGQPRLPDDEWDGEAAMLADVADCVAAALMRLSCDPDVADPFVVAVLEQVGARSMIRFAEVTPTGPLGLCAGVLWTVYARVATVGMPPS